MKQGVNRLVAEVSLANGPAAVGKKSQVRVLLKYVLRYALIGTFLYAIVRFHFLDISGGMLGLFLPVAAVFSEAVVEVFKVLIEDKKRGTR